jgi:carboxylate-amine ligase
MDAVSDVEDAIALAAYVQALVHRHVTGPAGERVHPVIAKENKWRAARYGLDAGIADHGLVPVRTRIEDTLRDLREHACELGCERELEGIDRILRDGNGATRQLRTFAEGGVRAVAATIVDTRR